MTSTDIGANPRTPPSAADYLDAGKGVFDAWFTGAAIAWWDASSLAALSDGDSVAHVEDKSGRGNALTRYVTSAGTPPTKATDAGSGKAVMRFNGSQKINCPALGVWPQVAISPEMTVVAIIKPSSTQASTTPKVIGGSGTTPFSLRLHNPASTPAKIAYATGGSITNTSLFGPSILDDAWHIVSSTIDASQTAIYQDNYETANIGAGGNTLSTAFATPDIGDLFVGDIGEMMIFDRKLPQRYLKVLHDYLNQKWAAGLTIRDSIAGSQAYETGATADTSTTRIWTPSAPKADAPLILWCHPQSQNEQIIPSYFAYGYVHASVAMGWYFAASSMGYSGSPGGSNSSWGNPTAQTALAQLYAVMNGRRTFSKVILAGASMGGLAAALAIVKDTLPAGTVKGAYFIDAALDLFAMYKTATYSPTIDSGYGISAGTLSASASANDTSVSSSVSYSGGTIIVIDPLGTNPETRTVASVSGAGPYTVTLTLPLTYAHSSGVKISDYGTKTSGNDPMIASVAKFAGLRTRFLASSADTTVVKTTNTDAFQARIAATAAESGIVSHLNGHLGSGAVQPLDFVEFVSRCIAA